MINELSSKLTIEVNGYNYQVEFPNNKQFIAIQDAKAMLAKNYDSFKYMGVEASYAESLIDMQAHFSILCPQLIKDLAKPIGDLNMLEGWELVKVYNNEFRSWYNKLLDFVFKTDKADKKAEGDKKEG